MGNWDQWVLGLQEPGKRVGVRKGSWGGVVEGRREEWVGKRRMEVFSVKRDWESQRTKHCEFETFNLSLLTLEIWVYWPITTAGQPDLCYFSPHLQSDRGPQLLTNSLVWVPEGGMLQITNRILRAEVPGASDSEITYAIIKDQPRYGKLILGFLSSISWW